MRATGRAGSSVYQDQRAAGTGGHHVRANDRLAGARRSDQNAAIVCEEGACGFILNRGEGSEKAQLKRLTADALIKRPIRC